MSSATPSVRWFDLYRQALLETNPDAMLGRLHLAGAAIRARELESRSADREEQFRLSDALRNLALLQREFDGLNGRKPEPTAYVTLSSPEHRWLAVSDGVCELLGYRHEEVLGRIGSDFVPPELRVANRELFARLLREGSDCGEHDLVSKTGRRIPIRYDSRIFPDGSIISYWYPKA